MATDLDKMSSTDGFWVGVQTSIATLENSSPGPTQASDPT